MTRLYSFLFILISSFAFGQSEYGVGRWKHHFPYYQGQHVALSKNKVYLATDYSLFALNKIDNSTETYSKVEGLSDYQFTAIAASKAKDELYIGYESGIIDILTDNSITHLVNLYQSNITGTKRINHFAFNGDYVYISSDFGVIVYDAKREEIKETYRNVGTNGDAIMALKTIVDPSSDKIMILTSEGVQESRLSHANLLDYNNWTHHTFSTNNFDNSWDVSDIAFLGSTSYLSTQNNGLFYLDNSSKWQAEPSVSLTTNVNHRLNGGTNSMTIVEPNRFVVLDKTLTTKEYTYSSAISDVVSDDGYFWLASQKNGLVRYQSSNKTSSYYPNGPDTYYAYNYGTHKDVFYALPLTFNNWHSESKRYGGYLTYQNGTWSPSTLPDQYKLQATRDMAYQESTGRLYFASETNGVLIQEPDGSYNIIDDKNKILSNGQWIDSPVPNYWPGARFPAIETDSRDNVWMVTYGVYTDANLFCMTNSGEFVSFTINHYLMERAQDIKVDDRGVVYILTGSDNTSQGLIAYHPESGAFRALTAANFFIDNPTCIDIDKNGDLWVGTVKGIQVMFEPHQVLEDELYQPEYTFYGSQPLLFYEVIRDIHVDGGNRKWIATTDGVYLASPSGTEVLAEYNTENSPLPSNDIIKIGINESSGEVFFTTPNGMVSYWGDATNAEATHSDNVKIFPNPVEPNYDGLVGISGLADDAIVKITDVAGRLVRELYANGGMISWDAKDVNGNKVSSGVYMVFSAEPNGEDTYVGKIVVIE